MGCSNSKYLDEELKKGFNIDYLPEELKYELLYFEGYDRHPEKDLADYVLIPKNIKRVFATDWINSYARIPTEHLEPGENKDKLGYGWSCTNIAAKRKTSLESYVAEFCYIKGYQYNNKVYTIYLHK
jgi:hypothetical protein